MAAPGASSGREGTRDTVVVVTGGDLLDARQIPPIPEGATVVAADSGIDRAHELGLRVDVAVGDFDSVTAGALERARADGAAIEQHPRMKDATDMELAMAAALALRPERILVLGGHGGRLDHLLANALLLASAGLEGVGVVAQMGAARVSVIRDQLRLTGDPGDVVTLLAVHGPAVGVTTDGLRYPLHDDVLAPGSTRGVSNELLQREATVGLRDGVLLAVQPLITTEPRRKP